MSLVKYEIDCSSLSDDGKEELLHRLDLATHVGTRESNERGHYCFYLEEGDDPSTLRIPDECNLHTLPV